MSETKFRIWSDYHKAWWRPNGAGYTNFRSAAGIYSKSEIYTKRDKPIPVDDPWDYHEESKRETARIEAALKAEKIDCRSDEGITVGLIDGMISIARVAAHRDLSAKPVCAALADIRGDEDVAAILGGPRWTPREIADHLMQRGLMLIYEDRAEVVDIETALTEIMGEEG